MRVSVWRLFPTYTGAGSLPLFTRLFLVRGCHSGGVTIIASLPLFTRLFLVRGCGVTIVRSRICESHDKGGYEEDGTETQSSQVDHVLVAILYSYHQAVSTLGEHSRWPQ